MNKDNIYALLSIVSHYLFLARTQCFKPNHHQINKIPIKTSVTTTLNSTSPGNMKPYGT